MRRLYRSSRDRKLFGVCGGLADYLNVDATLLRILLIVIAVFSAGSVILVYIIAGFVIPQESSYNGGYTPPPNDYGWRNQEQPHYGSATPGSTQGWRPNAGGWSGTASGAERPPAKPAFTPHGGGAGAAAGKPPAQGIDAMMEDIEKKAMQREIEELKARITKFEKEAKGE